MKTLNRSHFFDNYPFKDMTHAKHSNVDFLFDKLDSSELITRLSEMAYILATLKLETADTFAPVKEAYWIRPETRRINVLKKMYAGRKSIINPNGRLYYGRGFVQLTHIDNYIKMNPYIRKHFPEADIVSDPDSVCNAEYSWIILEEGMTNPNRTFKDDNFTGYTLENYFTDAGYDFYHARKIINGMDRASLVQSYAEKYFDILEFQEIKTAHKAINLIPLNVAEAQAQAENTSWQIAYNAIAEKV